MSNLTDSTLIKIFRDNQIRCMIMSMLKKLIKVQQRARLIATYPAKNGKACNGALKEIRSCNEDACIPTTPAPPSPVDCQLGEWSNWGSCSISCAEGLQTRSRSVYQQPSSGGKACQGDLKEVQGCNIFLNIQI